MKNEFGKKRDIILAHHITEFSGIERNYRYLSGQFLGELLDDSSYASVFTIDRRMEVQKECRIGRRKKLIKVLYLPVLDAVNGIAALILFSIDLLIDHAGCGKIISKLPEEIAKTRTGRSS